MIKTLGSIIGILFVVAIICTLQPFDSSEQELDPTSAGYVLATQRHLNADSLNAPREGAGGEFKPIELGPGSDTSDSAEAEEEKTKKEAERLRKKKEDEPEVEAARETLGIPTTWDMNIPPKEIASMDLKTLRTAIGLIHRDIDQYYDQIKLAKDPPYRDEEMARDFLKQKVTEEYQEDFLSKEREEEQARTNKAQAEERAKRNEERDRIKKAQTEERAKIKKESLRKLPSAGFEPTYEKAAATLACPAMPKGWISEQFENIRKTKAAHGHKHAAREALVAEIVDCCKNLKPLNSEQEAARKLLMDKLDGIMLPMKS